MSVRCLVWVDGSGFCPQIVVPRSIEAAVVFCSLGSWYWSVSVVLDVGVFGDFSRGCIVVSPVAVVYPIRGEGSCSLGSVCGVIIWSERPLCGAAWSLMSRASRFIS